MTSLYLGSSFGLSRCLIALKADNKHVWEHASEVLGGLLRPFNSQSELLCMKLEADLAASMCILIGEAAASAASYGACLCVNLRMRAPARVCVRMHVWVRICGCVGTCAPMRTSV